MKVKFTLRQLVFFPVVVWLIYMFICGLYYIIWENTWFRDKDNTIWQTSCGFIVGLTGVIAVIALIFFISENIDEEFTINLPKIRRKHEN